MSITCIVSILYYIIYKVEVTTLDEIEEHCSSQTFIKNSLISVAIPVLFEVEPFAPLHQVLPAQILRLNAVL